METPIRSTGEPQRDWTNYGDGGGPIGTDSTGETDTGLVVGAVGDQSDVTQADQTKTETKVVVSKNGAGEPELVQPDPNVDPEEGNKAVNKLFDPKVLVENAGKGADFLLETLDAAEYEEAAKIEVTDPEIIRIAKEKGIPPGVLLKAIQNLGDADLNLALNSLPPDQAQQIRFALIYPEAAKNLSPEQKQRLAEIKSSIYEQLRNEYGLSADWSGEIGNTASTRDDMETEFDNGFKTALDEYIATAQPPLTDEQIAKLKLLHYAPPGITLPDDPALKAVLATIEGNANEKLQMKYGFDDDWSPPVESEYYGNVINGAFLNHIVTNIPNYKPPISPETAAKINELAPKFFANPDDPSIPADIKTILTDLTAAAKTSVIKQFGLDPAWVPSVKALSPGLELGALSLAQGAVDALKAQYDEYKKVADAMPEGPEKQLLMNYLLKIGKVLSEMQEMIYAMQASKADISKVMSRLRAQIQEAKIAETQRKQAEVEEKKSKIESVIPIQDFMDVVTKVMVVACACVVAAMLSATGVGLVMGAFIIAMAITYVSKPDAFNPMFEAVQSGCIALGEKIGGPAGKEFGQILGACVNTYLAVVIGLGNPMLALALIANNAHVVENMAAGFGANENEQKIAAAVINGAAQIAVAVAMAVMTGGAGSSVLLATVLETVNVTEKTMRVAMAIARAIMVAFSLTTTTIQGYNQGVEINNALVNMDVTKLIAQLEAQNAELDALIDAIKALLQKIQNSLAGDSSWLLDIGQLQGAKYTSASQVSSEIWS